jgi:hypothetical protein
MPPDCCSSATQTEPGNTLQLLSPGDTAQNVRVQQESLAVTDLQLYTDVPIRLPQWCTLQIAALITIVTLGLV